MRYFLRMPSGDVVTFSVIDDRRVEVTGEGLLATVDARQCWADLVALGGKRFQCRDEDGHDGEDCTCAPEPEPVVMSAGLSVRTLEIIKAGLEARRNEEATMAAQRAASHWAQRDDS